MVLRIATKSASYSSLFYLPNPLAAALTRPSFQFLFAFMTVFLLTAAAFDMNEALKNGVRISSKLRLRVIQIRSGAVPQNAHFGFGVLLNEKEVTGNLTIDGPDITIDFPEPAAWNMWYFRTSPHSPDLDPIRFFLEEFNSDGKRWRAVGSSTDLLFMSTRTFLDGRYDTALRRNHAEIFDHRSDTGRVLQLITPIVVAVLTGLACLCALLNARQLPA